MVWRSVTSATLLLLSLGCTNGAQPAAQDDVATVTHETASPAAPRPATTTAAPADPARTVSSSAPTVILESPKDGGAIDANPILIRGRLRAFENHALLRLRDEHGEVIDQRPVTARGDVGQLNPFEATVYLTRDPGYALTVELLVDSPKDGSIVATAKRTWRFAVPSTDLSLAFSAAASGERDCRRTLNVKRRVPKSTQLARLVVESLLAGPTADERSRGASAPFPSPRPTILGITRREDLVIVDFDSSMSSVGGACRAEALRAMLERTLMALPGVARVEIRANGSAATALQP